MKNYSTLLLAILLSISAFAQPDCSNGRYDQEIFTNFNLTSNIQYGSNDDVDGNNVDLFFDLYEPLGDTVSKRPLLIMAHGGSFISGNKTGADVVPFCEDFAKKGYVTASMSYRLGIENFPFPGPDSSDASEAVMRATQDARALVRFFRKSVIQNGNPYKIDTNLIFFGGSSAGGFMAVHMAYMDEVSEIPSFIDTTANGLSGGLEGNTGSPGFSSEVTAIINLCGALGDTAWMKPNDTPIFSVHGDDDQTVPYGSETILLVGQYPLLEVDGSSSIHHQAQKLGMVECFKPFPGADHTPFCCSHQNENQYYDTTSSYMSDFMLHFTCNEPFPSNCSNVLSVIESEESTHSIEVFPNPNNGVFTIYIQGDQLNTVSLYNTLGEMVAPSINKTSSNTYKVDLSAFPKGVYFIRAGGDSKSIVVQ